MKAFMHVSQAIRDTMIFFLCMAMGVLMAVVSWLADEETNRIYKERHNHD